MSTQPSKIVETFENPAPQRDYTIRMEAPEFTCLCPLTGQPDFAALALEYVPDQLCLELKSFKLYLWSFRDERAFHETISNEMVGYLAEVLSPRYLRLTADFRVRGGITTCVIVEHRAPDWTPAPAVVLP